MRWLDEVGGWIGNNLGGLLFLAAIAMLGIFALEVVHKATAPTITLQKSDWICTHTADIPVQELVLVGKVPVYVTEKKLSCVTLVRKGYGH